MSRTQQSTSTKRDSDYYRRLGGYQGPVKLTASQVGCPTCEADPGEPCKEVKTFHRTRHAYAAELTSKANSDLPIARWYRSEFRAGRIPKPPRPCGTYGAYLRHKRDGQTISEMDEACQQAARKYWREAKSA